MSGSQLTKTANAVRHQAALRNRNEWLDTWDEHRIEAEELVSEGDTSSS